MSAKITRLSESLKEGEGIIMAASTTEQNPATAPQLDPADKRAKELREAVERVYRKYGTNLTAFYRDAHREAQRDSEKRAR